MSHIKQSFVILVIFTFSLFTNVYAQCPVTISSASNGKRLQLNGLAFTGVTNIEVSGSVISLNKSLTTGNRTHDQEPNNHFDPCFLPGNACSVVITHSAGTNVCDYDYTGTFKTTLPIELISFELMLTEQAVISNWITATEINNDFFTLERSTNAVNWTAIKMVNGAGNSTSVLEYVQEDPFLHNTDYVIHYNHTGQKSIEKMCHDFFKGTVCSGMYADPGMTPMEAAATLPPTRVSLEFNCQELFLRSALGTGNYISAFYGLRLAAGAMGNVDVSITCDDAVETKHELILPWMMGWFPRTVHALPPQNRTYPTIGAAYARYRYSSHWVAV